MLRTEARLSTSVDEVGTSVEGADEVEPVRVVVRGVALSWLDVAGGGILPYLLRGSQARHLFLRYLVGR